MAINIFEGARRISLLIAGIAIALTIYLESTNEPYVDIKYSVAHPTGQFIRTLNNCPAEAETHYFSTKTQSGKSVSVSLCLLAMSFGKNNDQLIPYKVDDKGVIWGARSYSEEVTAYEKSLEARFKMSSEEEVELEKEISNKNIESLKATFKYLFYGLSAFWVAVWAVGWIARGFLGIPRGSDKRPEPQ